MFCKPLTYSYSTKIIRQYMEMNGEYGWNINLELLWQFKIGGGGNKIKGKKMSLVKRVILPLSYATLYVFSFDISDLKLLQTHLTDVLLHVEVLREGLSIFIPHFRHTDLLTITGSTVFDI